jgi:hypothetical protein
MQVSFEAEHIFPVFGIWSPMALVIRETLFWFVLAFCFSCIFRWLIWLDKKYFTRRTQLPYVFDIPIVFAYTVIPIVFATYPFWGGVLSWYLG